MAVIEVKCRYCGQATVVKNGRAPNGLQRFHCRACRRYFQVEYHYNGHRPGTAQRIVDMTFNGSGVRDIGRVLGISKNTVIRRLKKLAPAQVSRQQQAISDVALICEMDEQWSWIGNKCQQHWLFYGFETKRKKVLPMFLGQEPLKPYGAYCNCSRDFQLECLLPMAGRVISNSSPSPSILSARFLLNALNAII